VTPDEIATSLAEQLGHGAAHVAGARGGREHHLYRLRLPEGERLLKFPREDALADPFDPARTPADRLRSEAWVLSKVRGVSVPWPYALHATEPICATMGIVPGTTGEIAYERGQLDEEGLVGVCFQMGKTLAAIHGRKRPETAEGIPDLPLSDPWSARLLHLDFHLGNVIGWPQLGGRWTINGVVDWTCARWGPPEADLVEMQISVFATNPRARDAFVAGYRTASGRAVDIAEVELRAADELAKRSARSLQTVPAGR
jgi:aminoglycoside phosphotransferase (APT) family kinase protein